MKYLERPFKFIQNIRRNRSIKERNLKIHEVCKELGIKDYVINDDGSIDVNGDIFLNDRLIEIPLKFRKVSGNFYASEGLTSLNGCPIRVEGGFICSRNKSLVSLVGGPKYVGGDYNCVETNIKSFLGAPEYIGRTLYAGSCPELRSFEGFPKYVGRCNFYSSPIYYLFRYIFTLDIFSDIPDDTDDIELFNDFDIIQDNDVIIERLEEFLRIKNKLDKFQKIINVFRSEDYNII